MQKIAALHQFLVNLNLVAAEQLDSWTDDFIFTPAGYPGEPGELVAGEVDYTATFNIERYPQKEHPAELLLAQLCAWLAQNDPDRTLSRKIELTVEPLDSNSVDVEFQIQFNESLIVIEDVNGSIDFNGTKYRLPS